MQIALLCHSEISRPLEPVLEAIWGSHIGAFDELSSTAWNHLNMLSASRNDMLQVFHQS